MSGSAWTSSSSTGNRSSRWTRTSAGRATRSRVCTSVRPRSTAWKRGNSSTTRKGASSSGHAPSCASTSGKTRSTGATLAVRTVSSFVLADPIHRALMWVRLLNEVALSNGTCSWNVSPSGSGSARRPDMLVEALIPDFQGDLDAVRTVVDSGVDVLDHNIETVERLQGAVRDRRANYAQSLKVLRAAKGMRSDLFSKSSIMLGLGETREEVLATMRDLRANEVDIVTVGQYLRPSSWHLAVQEYVPPEAFEELRGAGESMGFAYVAAGPLVRSSYRAGEFFLEKVIRERRRVPAG